VTVQRGDTTGSARRAVDARSADEEALVARLRQLSAQVAASPDEEFRAATRTRLVAMAAVRTPSVASSSRRPPVRTGALRRLLAVATDVPVPRWRTRLTAGLTGAALAVTAIGGLLGAAQGARPGDLLYDLKRGGEQTQLALAGDAERGSTLLEFASTRLDELTELVGAEAGADAVVGTTPSGGEAGLAAGPDVDLVLDTLQTMDEQTAEGTAALTTRAVADADAAALQTLTGWATEQQTGLEAVADDVPTGAEGALTASRDLVAAAATRGTELGAAVDCPGGPATAGADELGPIAATCSAAPPATGSAEPSGTSGPEPAQPGTSDASGTAAPTTAAAPGTAAPGATTGPAPTAAVPGATSAGGGALPTSRVPAPVTSQRPGLPTLPSLPTLPRPGSGAATTTTAPKSTPGTLLPLPTLVPGVGICAPPLVTVGC